ncbi:MAG: pyridoxal 5'-phosphate synthase glutaminase subunit PdxT [Acidobacteriota bacterium]|nr:pyridoxal 5'-phosphate synthase glutaminase subunit PdxT [Acidobacteriota bacterium]MDH3784093.1 pyridoxal 5'-phosphate synthase glutaminase subunit PdxT [Acidobacteriota bacterium]
MIRVGILALQGDFAAHAAVLSKLGRDAVEVRGVGSLDDVDALIIPGGESTTLLNLMQDEPWFDRLRDFHDRGGSILGTCAGAIVLAREVLDPHQPSLGLLPVTIRRNGYGRQVDSFETEIDVAGESSPKNAVFIRAPRLDSWDDDVQVLALHAGEPVLVAHDRVMAATFHPEITGETWLHRRFLETATERIEKRIKNTVRTKNETAHGGMTCTST